MTYLIDPDGERVDSLAFTPPSREMICHFLGLWPYAPIEIHGLGGVEALDSIGRTLDAAEVELVAVTPAQPAAVNAEPDAYTVAGRIFSGRALLAARHKSAPPLLPSLTAPSNLLRPRLTPDDARALVEWRAGRLIEQGPAQRYDLTQLERYVKRLCAVAAEPANRGGGVLRLYAIDPYGAEAGAYNALAADWRAVTRYALDNFDRGHSTLHEWALRANAPLGSAAATPPICCLADLSENPDAQAMCLHLPKGDVFISPRVEPWKPGKKAQEPRRLPFPGVPVIAEPGETLIRWSPNA